MRALAILCAVVNLVAMGFVAWLMWFVALFPWENLEPEDRTANDWLVPAAVLLLASAAGLLLCVVVSWQRWAAGALVLQTTIGVGVLAYALEGSDHSDGTLVAAVLAIELAAVAAVWLSRADAAASRPLPARR